MANISTKSSVLGVKAETTEGTLIDPAAATDYVKLQEDATLTENKETLDNAELTGSIGAAEPVPGLSAPALSFSSYLKHSGVEGQAPEAGPLLKSLYGGERVASTEYNTVAGSTVSVVKVDTGEGVNFARGDALLVKDSVNGFSVRPIESVTGDDLTLGFDLPGAPAAGVDLGKFCTYYPTDTGHDTLSCHMYWGNGGLHQAVSGARVLGYDLTEDAGQLINASFTIEGINFYNNPIEITASTKYIDVTETGPVIFAASVAEKVYQDPEELASALQTSINAAATTDTFTVVYNSTGANAGKFTISSDGTLLSLLWSTGANTANTIGEKLGFTVSADDTGATSYIGDSALDFGAPHTPSYDAASPMAAKNMEVLFGDSSADITCINPSTISIAPANTKASINDICAVSGQSGSLITSREVVIGFTAVIPQYCVKNFARYRRNDTVRFASMFGTKADGTNWDAGFSGCIYAPTAKIQSIEVVDEDGIARISAEVKAFVSNGLGEIYHSLV